MTGRGSTAVHRCAAARRRLIERESGLLGTDAAERLERHLSVCVACRREATLDRALTTELASLRLEYPYPIDVRQRVLGALAAPGRSRRPEPEFVPADQLGLAAAVAVAAAIAIAVATGLGLDAILGGARQMWTIAGTAADALLPLTRAALELAVVPLRAVLRALAGVPGALTPFADRWLPSAFALTALAYGAMGLTLARVIARGFVSAPAAGRHGRAT